jgi:hypothetical protein
LPEITEWHLLQAETSRIDEYVEVARFVRRYQKVVSARRWSATFEIGKRMLPLPGRLESAGEQWLKFALSIFRNNATKEFKTMDKKFHFNGLNGSTGAPLVPPMGPDELIEWIKAGDQNEEKEIKDVLRTTREQKDRDKLGLIEGIDPLNLKEAKWGVVYAEGISQQTKDALGDLVKARNGTELTYKAGCLTTFCSWARRNKSLSSFSTGWARTMRLVVCTSTTKTITRSTLKTCSSMKPLTTLREND